MLILLATWFHYTVYQARPPFLPGATCLFSNFRVIEAVRFLLESVAHAVGGHFDFRETFSVLCVLHKVMKRAWQPSHRGMPIERDIPAYRDSMSE